MNQQSSLVCVSLSRSNEIEWVCWVASVVEQTSQTISRLTTISILYCQTNFNYTIPILTNMTTNTMKSIQSYSASGSVSGSWSIQNRCLSSAVRVEESKAKAWIQRNSRGSAYPLVRKSLQSLLFPSSTKPLTITPLNRKLTPRAWRNSNSLGGIGIWSCQLLLNFVKRIACKPTNKHHFSSSSLFQHQITYH